MLFIYADCNASNSQIHDSQFHPSDWRGLSPSYCQSIVWSKKHSVQEPGRSGNSPHSLAIQPGLEWNISAAEIPVCPYSSLLSFRESSGPEWIALCLAVCKRANACHKLIQRNMLLKLEWTSVLGLKFPDCRNDAADKARPGRHCERSRFVCSPDNLHANLFDAERGQIHRFGWRDLYRRFGCSDVRVGIEWRINPTALVFLRCILCSLFNSWPAIPTSAIVVSTH